MKEPLPIPPTPVHAVPGYGSMPQGVVSGYQPPISGYQPPQYQQVSLVIIIRSTCHIGFVPRQD